MVLVVVGVFALLVAWATVVGLVGGSKIDRFGPTYRNVALVTVPLLVGALLVRTRRLQVTRRGRVLRIRSGKRESSVLASEVLEVEIDTEAVRAHTVVFVLRDGRRIPVGESHERMLDALSDRRALRDALLR